jgi:hypothetical protein
VSFLDNMLHAYGGGGGRRRSMSSPSDPFQSVQNNGSISVPMFSDGVQSSREAGPPDRLDVSPDRFKIGETDVTGGVEAGSALAAAPGYIRERPVAALDTLIGNATGVKPVGEVEKFVGGIPIVGPVLGVAGDILRGKPQSAAFNALDVNLAVQHLHDADSTILNVHQRVQPGHAQRTIGDLRLELAKRGITPEDIDAVANGTKSALDFGDNPISSNPWVSLGVGLLTDPTNLLLATPLGGVKAGALAARLGLAGEKALTVVKGSEIFESAIAKGLTKTALDAKSAAGTIARELPGGDATMAGVGQFFKVVSRGGKSLTDLGIGTGKTIFGIKGQVASTAAPIAIDFLADHTDKSTPVGGLFENLRSVADQIENNKPLSQYGLFSMYAALNFPLRSYVRQGWGKAVDVKNAGFGTGELDRFSKALGVSKKDLVAWAGTPENVAAYVDFIDEKIALDRLKSHPLDTAYLGSFQEAAVRFAKTRDLNAAVVADMRAKGEITMADRAQAARDWYTAQGEQGFRGVRMQWDPKLAMQQWQSYQQIAQHAQPMLAQAGVTLGLNDASSAINSTVSKQDISGFISMVRRKAVNGYIAPRELQGLLDVLPLQKLGRNTEYWDKVFIRGAKPVSIKSLEAKLGKMRAEAPEVSELLAGFTKREAAAPHSVRGMHDPASLGNILEGPEIAASRMRPELSAEVGLPEGPTSLFEARVARGHPTVQQAETGVPKALAQAGFPVQQARRTMGGWAGGLEPSFVSTLSPVPIKDLRLAASMAGHSLDQDAVLLKVVSKEHMVAAGVRPNSRSWTFSNLPSAHAAEIIRLAGRAFPDGFTYDQVAGVLEVIVPEEGAAAALGQARSLQAELKAAIPQNDAGAAEVAAGRQRKIYAEWVGRDTYGRTIDDAVRAGDSRVYAYDALSSELAGASERAANLSLSEGGGSLGGGLGLGGSRLPRTARDWGDVVPGEIATPGRPASAAEELRSAVDARGFGGANDYVTFAAKLDQDASSTFPLPKERVRPVDGPEFFDMTPEEYAQPLLEKPTEVAPAPSLVRTELQQPKDLGPEIQAAYDAGDTELGQSLQRQAEAERTAGPQEVPAAEHQAILEAAAAGEELGVRPGVATSIAETPPEYLVRRDAETGEWVPLLDHAEALAVARAGGRAPLAGLHPALRNMDPATLEEINGLEAFIRENYPRYRLEPAPKIATGVKPKNAQQVALKEYNALGEWLFNGGRGNIFSPAFNFMHWAMTPKHNLELHQAAEQALLAEVISRGGTAKHVEKFLSLARLEADSHTFGSRNVRLFRDWSSLPANTINRIAVEAGMPVAVTDALGAGRFHLLVDRATSRFYRSMEEAELKGGRRGALGRGLSALYDTAQTGPGVHYLYDVERATAKVFYHIFRFVSDPRWWTYNILEADTINAARYGIGSTRFGGKVTKAGDQASFIHGEGRLPSEGELARSTKKGQAKGKVPAGQHYLFKDEAPGHYSGWNDNRNLATYIIKAFDGERAASTGEALRNLGEHHPVIQALRDRFGENVDDWVRGVDETMYRFDTLGVKGTIDEAARELEAQGPHVDPRDAAVHREALQPEPAALRRHRHEPAWQRQADEPRADAQQLLAVLAHQLPAQGRQVAARRADREGSAVGPRTSAGCTPTRTCASSTCSSWRTTRTTPPPSTTTLSSGSRLRCCSRSPRRTSV